MVATIVLSPRWKGVWQAGSALFGMSCYAALILSLVFFFTGGVPYLPFLGIDIHELFILSTIGLFFGGVVLSGLTAKSALTKFGVLLGALSCVLGLLSFAVFIYWVIVMVSTRFFS